MIVTGDSIAVGLGSHLPEATAVRARVGRESREGLRVIRSLRTHVLVVSLGINDDPAASAVFRRRVRLAIDGRDVVVWLTMRRHPAFNDALRDVARDDHRLCVVSGIVPTVDGTHPTPGGYRTLRLRVRRALRRSIGYAAISGVDQSGRSPGS